MSLPLDEIEKGLNYYLHVDKNDLQISDAQWLIYLVEYLLGHVNYQRDVISNLTDTLSRLGISMDPLKKQVGTFMRKRHASEDIESEYNTPKRLKNEVSHFSSSQKREHSDDDDDEAERPTKARKSKSFLSSERLKRYRGEEAEDKNGNLKRQRMK